MKPTSDIDWKAFPSPCYVIDEAALRRNLALMRNVTERSGAEMILALKAFAGWGVFPIMKEYVKCATASSLNEARLAYEGFGTPVHAYAPVYTAEDFPEILKLSSHVTFNSLSQYEHYKDRALSKASCGLRINPEYSVVKTDLYNPATAGSRLGITAAELNAKGLPEGIEGLHFHTLCEGDSYQLEKTLEVIEEKFGRFLPQLKWLNMGGGHLITREGYDTEHLVSLLHDFKKRYPCLHIILEPGSAFTWRTGWLVSTIGDVVENHGLKSAMLDVSFACHMPDCLEMPYKPQVLGATEPAAGDRNVYRMGGNSCLAGDYCGDWAFDHELQVGERIVFDDMIHYTMVKTTMFNGVAHPSIGLLASDKKFRLIKRFGFGDYKSRLS